MSTMQQAVTINSVGSVFPLFNHLYGLEERFNFFQIERRYVTNEGPRPFNRFFLKYSSSGGVHKGMTENFKKKFKQQFTSVIDSLINLYSANKFHFVLKVQIEKDGTFKRVNNIISYPIADKPDAKTCTLHEAFKRQTIFLVRVEDVILDIRNRRISCVKVRHRFGPKDYKVLSTFTPEKCEKYANDINRNILINKWLDTIKDFKRYDLANTAGKHVSARFVRNPETFHLTKETMITQLKLT